MSATTDSPHPEAAAKYRDLQARFEAQYEVVEQMEAARGEAMFEGRQLDPPMTFRELADCFNVTVGAIQARVVREQAKRA